MPPTIFTGLNYLGSFKNLTNQLKATDAYWTQNYTDEYAAISKKSLIISKNILMKIDTQNNLSISWHQRNQHNNSPT